MYTSKEIDYLKRKVKRTYKWYTGERTDGVATILDIARLFKLHLDEKTLSDYEVKSFDSKVPSIEIFCKKDNSTYFAEYSSSSQLLGCHGGEVRFINHLIDYSDSLRRETTLSLWQDVTFYDKFSVKIDEQYTLLFIRINPHPLSPFYFEHTQSYIALDDKSDKEDFAYSTGKPQAKLYQFEVEKVYPDEEYQYTLNSGIIYVSRKHSDVMHATLFCENVFKDVDEYMPYSMPFGSDIEAENNSLINDQVYSAIFFYGLSAKLRIFKECTNFKVKYTVRNKKERTVKELEYLIPVLTSCAPIDYMECEYLESELAKIIEDKDLLENLQEKFREIKFRLMVSKGLAHKEETVLSIKKYLDLPFEEAMKLIVENKEEIFAEIMKKLK